MTNEGKPVLVLARETCLWSAALQREAADTLTVSDFTSCPAFYHTGRMAGADADFPPAS